MPVLKRHSSPSGPPALTAERRLGPIEVESPAGVEACEGRFLVGPHAGVGEELAERHRCRRGRLLFHGRRGRAVTFDSGGVEAMALGDAGATGGAGDRRCGRGPGMAGSGLIHGANGPPALGPILAWPISMAAPVRSAPATTAAAHPSPRTAAPGPGGAQDLPRRPADRRGGDAAVVLAEGPEQRAVADGIDQPGDAAGGAMHRARGRVAHDLFLRARDLQAMRDIGPRVGLGEWPEMIARGDSLGELSAGPRARGCG